MASGTGVQIDGFDAFSDDLREFARKLRNSGLKVEEPVSEGTRRGAEEILDGAKKRAPGEPGGELKRSGHLEQSGDTTWSVIFDAEHAAAQEYGSRPDYDIFASEAGALSFTAEERTLIDVPDNDYIQVDYTENEVVVDKVTHPGVEAQRFLRSSITHNQHKVGEYIDQELDRFLDRHFGK